ncbi:MAG: hypothetical protein Terrestrivirus5_87 [Terrestrivirus sp.]|uniref:Uncharacterized protein n=1 Tax=Terrestrivirus sp. TaxID=2487775 RepID=A0A3G4ZN24_9VIRU|nr:MAG: hypothetical protein Terrestrivirus5_87 [Terrestrivirus sp.]
MRPGAASIGSSRGVRHRIAEKHNFAPRHVSGYGSNHHHNSHKKKHHDDDSPGLGERFTETMSSISKWFGNQFSKLKKKRTDDSNQD